MSETPTDTDNVIPETELARRRRVLGAVAEMANDCAGFSARVMELREMGVPVSDWLPLLASHSPEFVQVLHQRYGNVFAGMVDGFLDARAAGAKTGTEGVIAALLGSAMRTPSRSPIGDVAADLNAAGAHVSVRDEEIDPQEDRFFSFETLRMKRVIDRLFAEAPKLTDAKGQPDPTQAPAVQCQILLKAGGGIVGALSVTPEGTLRLLAPNQNKNGQPMMVEHFFDYEQVADIAVVREMKATEGTRIVTS